MTRNLGLVSSNTESDPSKFHDVLDSFGEERLWEKVDWCGADTLVRELCKYSRTAVAESSRPHAGEGPFDYSQGRSAPQTRITLSHHGRVLRPDFVHHANFSRLGVGIFVLSQVLLRQFVDVLVCAVLGNLDHGAADLQIAIRIVGVDNGQRHSRIAAHVAVLLPAARRIKDYMLTVEVAPYRSDLRPSVGHQRAQTGECWLLEKVDVFFRNHVGHR